MTRNKIQKKGLVAVIILLLVGISVFTSSATNNFIKKSSYISLDGNTLNVGGSGEDNYTKIQDAINNATKGDTVFVYAFSSPYYENVIVDKSISLFGEDNETTVIDAKKNGTPIRIIADGCQVSGFTILNCEGQINQDWGDAVIKIDEGLDVIIKDNILNAGEVQTSPYANYGTIDLNGCAYCEIINNYVVQSIPNSFTIGIAIHDNSSNNIVSENDLSHYNFGIGVTSNGFNHNNIISENHIHHNTFGVAIENGYNELLNNIIEYNTEVGINIQNGYNNNISFNIIQYNGEGDKFYCGIELMGDISNNKNIVSDNIISYNNPCGLQTEYSHGNIITRNNFIDNYGEGDTPERWWGNAYFHIQDGLFNKDRFKNNYWSDSVRFFPKIIYGILEVIPHGFTINWINFDWRPAKEPYDI